MIHEPRKDRIMYLPHIAVLRDRLLLYTTYTRTVFLERKPLILISGYHALGWATSFMSEQSTFETNKLLFSAETLGMIPCSGCIQFPLSFLLRTCTNLMKTTHYRVRKIDAHVPQWKTGRVSELSEPEKHQAEGKPKLVTRRGAVPAWEGLCLEEGLPGLWCAISLISHITQWEQRIETDWP